MNFPLLIYRISGWSINLSTLFLAFVALKSKKIWKGKYVFLGIWFVCLAITELVSSITAVLAINNLFLDYYYGSISFGMKTLYLSRQYKQKWIHWLGYICVAIFVFLQIYKAYFKAEYNVFNAFGAYSSTIFFLIFSIINLNFLFRKKNYAYKLRSNPDLWFTVTLFCFSSLGLIISVLATAQSENVLYALYISENFIKVFLYFGYYRGIKSL